MRLDSVARSLTLLFRVPSASEGNNDWKPDRIPKPPNVFPDHAVPCVRLCGALEGEVPTAPAGPSAAAIANVVIRPGAEDDLAPLTDIYNHYVRETPVTFDTAAFTPEERRPWFDSHPQDGPYRLLVAQEQASGTILGYVTSSPFRPKPAYASTVETTIYLAPDAVGRGIGTLLYTRLFEALAGENLHRAVAGATQPNPASVRLHKRLGFQYVGTYREVGWKFGRYHDVAWFEKALDQPLDRAPDGI